MRECAFACTGKYFYLFVFVRRMSVSSRLLDVKRMMKRLFVSGAFTCFCFIDLLTFFARMFKCKAEFKRACFAFVLLVCILS